jgi:putative ABC transport system substrate-binding protein
VAEAFQNALGALGYRDQDNIDLVWRYSGPNLNHLQTLAADLVVLGVDVFVAAGLPAALAASQSTEVVPIVAVLPLGSALEWGLAASLNRPGRNVTGLVGVVEGSDLWEKRQELLRLVAPSATRVALPVNAR